MPEPSSTQEYLLLSRGQWDADKSPQEIQAARDAQIRADVDRLCAAGHGPDISRLTDHLNARRAGPPGGSAQP